MTICVPPGQMDNLVAACGKGISERQIGFANGIVSEIGRQKICLAVHSRMILPHQRVGYSFNWPVAT
jgi:hypothetical protein